MLDARVLSPEPRQCSALAHQWVYRLRQTPEGRRRAASANASTASLSSAKTPRLHAASLERHMGRGPSLRGLKRNGGGSS